MRASITWSFRVFIICSRDREKLEYTSAVRAWSIGFPFILALIWGAIPLKVVALGSASSVVASLAAASASSLPGMSWDPLDGDVPNALIQAGFELVDFSCCCL